MESSATGGGEGDGGIGRAVRYASTENHQCSTKEALARQQWAYLVRNAPDNTHSGRTQPRERPTPLKSAPEGRHGVSFHLAI